MNDMRAVIVPKSDQLNADDLIGRSLTIKVTKVSIAPATEQPVSINFEGDGGKPYRPCKSMCRVMVYVWGPDANAYVGRSMTLYRDEKARFGGLDVGGIRISHISHIQSDVTMALTVTKGSKKPFTVKPMVRTRRDFLDDLHATLAACHTVDEVEAIAQAKDVEKAVASFTNGNLTELNAMLAEALARVNVNTDASNEPEEIDL